MTEWMVWAAGIAAAVIFVLMVVLWVLAERESDRRYQEIIRSGYVPDRRLSWPHYKRRD